MSEESEEGREVATTPKHSLLATVADRYGMEPRPFELALRATVFPKDASAALLAAFLVVANEYKLNPLTKEIYAFPTRNGGIQPIVSVDGWSNLINSNPAFNGMVFEDIHGKSPDDVIAIRCKMYRKDREHPIEVTEYMAECRRDTDTWKKWPRRMLRHKSMIQAARYAFGFAGIMDPDEFDRSDMGMRDVTPKASAPSPTAVAPSPTSAPSPEPVHGEVISPKKDVAPKVVEAIDEPLEIPDDDEPATAKQTAAPGPSAPAPTPKPAAAAPPTGAHDPTTPAGILAIIEQRCTGFDGTVDDFADFWNATLASIVECLPMHERQDAIIIYERHEARLKAK